MIYQDYVNQFNIKPVSELEAYCKWEGVSLLFIRRPENNRFFSHKLGIAVIVLGTIFTKRLKYLAAVLGKTHILIQRRL